MHEKFTVQRDAFSSGQISSKLWLCRELEKIPFSGPQIVWLYGGWHATTAMLLLSREILPIKYIRSFDIDPEYETIANNLLENWVWDSNKFKAITHDCNNIPPYKFGEFPDIVINTSTEHFESNKWFTDIKRGTTVVFHSNNMPHEDHVISYNSVDEFATDYKLSVTHYKGSLDFVYPTWSFSRYMIIGVK